MAAIGRVLGDLTDAAARQRVLRWACERFGADSAQMPAAGAVVAEAPARPDLDLAVDGLTDMFVTKTAGSDDDSLSLEPSVAVETEKAPLASVLRSFAADFQRFADEWNGAAA